MHTLRRSERRPRAPITAEDVWSFHRSFKWAPQSVKNDKEYVLRRVTKWPEDIVYASRGLRGDRDIVAAAVKGDHTLIEWASDSLLRDANFVLQLMSKHDGWRKVNLYCICKAKDDRRVVLALFEPPRYSWRVYTGPLLDSIPAKFRADPVIVLKCIQRNGRDIQHADARFQNDPRYLRIAAKRHDSLWEIPQFEKNKWFAHLCIYCERCTHKKQYYCYVPPDNARDAKFWSWKYREWNPDNTPLVPIMWALRCHFPSEMQLHVLSFVALY